MSTTLYRYQGVQAVGGAYTLRPVNGGPLLLLGQAPPAPPPTILHGSELPATSGEAELMIGAQGPLTEYPSGDFTAAMGPLVIENASFTEKSIRVRSGANVTLRNCLIIAPPGSNTYAVRINEGGNARLLMEDCTIVCRTTYETDDGNHNIAGWGDTSLCLRRCVIRGGIDGIHFHGKGPAIWPTGDPVIPMATMLVEECWLGDNERLPGSHSDLVQMAGARPNRVTNFVWRRNRFMAYSLPLYVDTLTSRADPETSGFASVCWIDTTGGHGTGTGATRMTIRDNWFQGGNWMVQGGGNDVSPAAFTGNLFAPHANFGAATGMTGFENYENRWAYDGTLTNGTVCVGGELIPGSAEAPQ